MTTELDWRTASEDDVPGILETMQLALGESPLLRRTPSLWHWKHTENPFGPSIVLVAVAGDGTIAGVRAFMRWELETGTGQTIKCVRPVDTATHPSFTRRGIFRSLTMKAIDVARDEGVDLIFNTPNEKSAPGYLKMSWQHVSWIGAQVRIRVGPAVSPDPDKRPAIETVSPDALAASTIPTPPPLTPHDNAMRTPRSEEYIAWRFSRHPYASYGWVPGDGSNGLVVRASVRNGRSELVAADILGPPDRTPIVNAARGTRARYVAGWFSPGTPKRAAAIRGGLLPVPGIKALRLVAMKITDFGIDPFSLGSWDLSTSDLELL